MAEAKTKKEPTQAERIEALEKEVAELRELMRKNGWTC